MLSLAYLGPFEVTLDQRSLTQFQTVKAQALLIYLSVESRHTHQREALMALLWPGLPLQSAQQSLRQTLYRLRQVIEPDKPDSPFIQAERFTLAWNQDASYKLDVTQFESLSGIGRSPNEWQQAADLYRGEFLADFYLSDSETFEEWALGRRALYHRTAKELFQRLADYYLQQGNYVEAESAVRRNLELDYFQETAHQRLINILAANGRRQEALLHFDDYRQRLRDELTIEPEEETVQLVQAIRSGEQTLPEVLIPQKAKITVRIPPAPNNLPTPPTPFIGRKAELAALDELMSREDGRLVTIVGPGGMGKTRLAVAWAADQIHYQNGRHNGDSTGLDFHPYQHGLSFLNLAPLTSADLIIPTLANTLNFPIQRSSDLDQRSPKQQILDYLCRKRMLLLFDNFEHLLDGVNLIVDILEAASHIKILVTSRERLNLRQEQVFPIEGLEFPDWETPEDAAEYTAVRLFLQSARRNQPDFELRSGADLTYLARICRLVAGMPLAIELAAAWVEMLSLEEIADEIQQGLDILETELRDAPPRQRSVRATIDYSWQKLSDREQEIFAKLSVFRGGFTRDAAEAVTGANLRQLSRLQNKSLLQVEKETQRYQLHELLRQYAAEVLSQDKSLAEEINGRHARYFVKFLSEQESSLYGPDETETLNQLDVERDNIEVAWQWLVDHLEIGPLLDGINSLSMYYDIRVRIQDGLELCNELINWCNAAETDHQKLLLARALNIHCQINLYYVYDDHTIKANLSRAAELLDDLSQSDFVLNDDLAFNRFLTGLFVHDSSMISDEALGHYEAALQLFQRAGNLWGIVLTLQNMATGTFHRFDDKGGYKQALKLADLALKVARTLKSNRLMTELVAEVGTIALQAGDFALMKTLMVEVEKSLVRLREQGRHFEPERLLERYGWMLSIAGEMEAALATHLEFQALRQEMGFPVHAVSEFQFGQVLAHNGRYAEAQAHYETSLGLVQKSTHLWVEGLNLIVIGMNLIAMGDLEPAESVLRRGLALQDQIDNGTDRAGNLGNLGLALCRQGKYREAKQRLLESLELIIKGHGYLPLIEALPGIALTLPYDKPPRMELALKTYGLLLSQPYYTASRLFQDMSGRYLQEFVDSLPPDESQSALENGRNQELWTGTAELLAALKDLGWGKV